MRYFEDMMDGLQKNNEVPQMVTDRLDAVLENLPDCEGRDVGFQMKKMGSQAKKGGKKGIWKGAVAIAAVFAAAFMVCYTNPVLASRIPVISQIFGLIEKGVPFSGNYSQDAGQPVAADAVSDNGITITASEVYCDGLSVFLSAQVDAGEGGFAGILPHSLKNSDALSDALYLRGQWKLSGEDGYHPLNAYFMEGKVIDDHSYAGMIKLDLDSYGISEGMLDLQLSSIGWDDMAAETGDDISETCRVDGQWNFMVPFQSDLDSLKELEVNQTQNGYTIRKVFVSPYQVVSLIEAPVTHLEKEISRADYEAKLGLSEGEDDPELSYEQYVEMQTTGRQPCETVICNQDGELLPMGDMSTTSGKTTFAVNEKELSTLHVYVFTDYEDYEKADGTIDMESATERAVVSAEISVE